MHFVLVPIRKETHSVTPSSIIKSPIEMFNSLLKSSLPLNSISTNVKQNLPEYTAALLTHVVGCREELFFRQSTLKMVYNPNAPHLFSKLLP